MRTMLAGALGGTLLLTGCAPAILSVQADPPAPREGTPFVVKAAIKTTDASQQPTLGINQTFALPAAVFGPVPMSVVSSSGSDLAVQSAVPGGALTPSLSYGTTLQLTVSVPWRDLLAQTNVVRATLPLTIGAPANCRSFDEPQRTAGWQIRPFQRITFSSTGQATLSNLSGVPAALTWTADDNYPYPVPQQGAVRLKLPPELRALSWNQSQSWVTSMSVDRGSPARAVTVALKGDLVGTVRAVAMAEYKDSLVDAYYNTREFRGGSVSAADGDGWRTVELLLPSDFGSDHYEYTNAAGQRTSIDIPGRLVAVELFFTGVGNNVSTSADKSLLIDWVCFLPPAN